RLEVLNPSLPSLPAASRPNAIVPPRTGEAMAATMQAATTPAPGPATPARTPPAPGPPQRRRPPAPAPRPAAGPPPAAGASAWLLRPARQTSQAAPPPAPAAPRKVRWEVASKPSGAAVLREDGTLLGQTPWVQERPVAEGKTVVTLRQAGYDDLTFSI